MTRVLATYNIKGAWGRPRPRSTSPTWPAGAARGRCCGTSIRRAPQRILFRVKPKVRGGGRRLVRLKSDPARLIKGTDHEGLDLLPADFSYRHMDLVLKRFKRPTRRLAKVLEPLRGEYDYVFLDCPPSISLVSESVFEAADALLVPIIPATLSSRTLDQLEALLNGGVGRLQVLAFFSMVDGRKRMHREVMEQPPRRARERAGGGDSLSAEVERMGVERTVLASFAAGGRAAAAYEALWEDVLTRLRGNSAK